MSFAKLETAVLAEAKEVFNNPKLTKPKILEWSTGPVKAEAGQVVARLPKLGVNVCVMIQHDKR